MNGSYTSGGQTFRDIVRQATSVRRFYSTKIEGRVTEALTHIRQVECNVLDAYGVRLRDLDVLELGPGQFFGQMAYLALHNRVVGVDRDVVGSRFSPLIYVRMLSANGAVRTAKTLGRKILGFDRRYRKELCKKLGLTRLPKLDVRCADARDLPFESGRFDFAYSRAMFQHLPAPVLVIREMARVLKPRAGIAYVSLQPYTSPTGCLDPRALYGGIDNELGLWPHLRPELENKVRPNAYVNKLRIREWVSIFRSVSEDAKFVITPVDGRYVSLAKSLKQEGHLQSYSIEELTAGALDVVFRLQS